MDPTQLVAKAMQYGAAQIPEEITAFVDFLKSRGPLHNVMEIGSESGGTFFLWCRLTVLGGLKISVDLPSGTSGSGRFDNAKALAARTTLLKSWSANVHVVTGDSHEQKTWQEVNSILGPHAPTLDLLFLDGDHSYEGVKADWNDYRGFVRPGGLVAFHDIADSHYHRRRGCEVARFWGELRATRRNCREFSMRKEWGGIGCVTV